MQDTEAAERKHAEETVEDGKRRMGRGRRVVEEVGLEEEEEEKDDDDDVEID